MVILGYKQSHLFNIQIEWFSFKFVRKDSISLGNYNKVKGIFKYLVAPIQQ